jgi:hypothetical protein
MPIDLQPKSTISAVVLPATGTYSDIVSALSYGIYTSSAFISGAYDQVSHTYQKLGGNVLDLEITPSNVYNSYEEACLEYSYLINTHQAKNVLSDMLGNNTGSFNQDGEMIAGTYAPGNDVKPNLKFPRFQLGYATHIGRGASMHAGVGASQRIYSASFALETDKQDYDLQGIIYTASLAAASPFYNKVGNSAITVQNVYYKTPGSSWIFFGGTPVGTVGNMSTYGMYADDSTFELVPAWQNILQAYAYEEDLNVRASHWSYKINNNYLRIFPTPQGGYPKNMWVDFRVAENAFDEEATRQYGADGVSSMNTLPFPNVPYKNINSIGKQWIRRFALSLSKETLGQVRAKLASIPIPGNDVTLNGPSLISESKDEQQSLREELKTVLDEMVYGELAKGDAELQNNINDVIGKIPRGIYVG